MILAHAEHEGHLVELELHDQRQDRLNQARFCDAALLEREWPVLAFVTPPAPARGRLWVRLAVTVELWRTDPRAAALLAAMAVDVARGLPGYRLGGAS